MTEPYEPIGRKSRKLEGSVVLPNSAAASFSSSPYRSAKVVTFPMSSKIAPILRRVIEHPHPPLL
jgi:hypothetical protein